MYVFVEINPKNNYLKIFYLFTYYHVSFCKGFIMETIVSALCISIQHIENYLMDQPCSSIKPLQGLSTTVTKWKTSQIESRAKLYLFSSAVKIGLMFGFAFAFITELGSPVNVFPELPATNAGKFFIVN